MSTVVDGFVPELRKLDCFFQGNCAKNSSGRRGSVLEGSHCVLRDVWGLMSVNTAF